jgi:hypothetical protein
MARTLKWLALIMGVACVLIGVYHVVLGIPSVPGEGTADTLAGKTVDSRERFYNGIFAGYGLLWLWVARRRPIPATVVRMLSAAMFLGGIGRVVSVVQYGWPHWFQVPLAVIEVVVPPVLFWLAAADERRAAPREQLDVLQSPEGRAG